MTDKLLLLIAIPAVLIAGIAAHKPTQSCSPDITANVALRVTRKQHPNAFLECKNGELFVNLGDN